MCSGNNVKKYRSIFISDLHLGTVSCRAKELLEFLKNNDCDTLYLVGDILDGWKVSQNKWRWSSDQSKVIERIIKMGRKHQTKIIYTPGNHDEFLRPILGNDLTLGEIELHNTYTHIGVDGKKYIVVHGDLFDGITSLAPWLSFLGDKMYDFLIFVNTYFNAVRHKLGFGYWSLSKYLKYRVKTAIDFIFKFEINLSEYAKRKGFDGCIVGHIHHPEIKKIGDIWYANCGDWVENCSAIIEDHAGNLFVLQLQSSKWVATHLKLINSDAVLFDDAANKWFQQQA
jgi:UDP-2,3-diacylglucosamine pyrophosphatase LpxH